jgi:predicted ArsR family transcriptional regulator
MRTRARKRILDYVTQQPGVDVAQVARALGMTAPAVRHHLSILRSDGRIEVVATSPGPRRGRPRMGYRASEELAGNNLAMLAEHLLSVWNEDSPPRRDEPALVAKLANMLSEKLQSAPVESKPARRLAALVDRLNQLHYRSRWEAGAEGPRIIFGKCPYAAVVERHPELCGMDAKAIGAVMNAEVQQRAKIDPRVGGAANCVFTLRYL